MMNIIFDDYLDHFTMLFIDDILIYSKIWEDHEVYLQKALEKLRQETLYAKFEK